MSKIRKRDIKGCLDQLHKWVEANKHRVDSLHNKPMREYMQNTISDIENRIKEQDYDWGVQSLIRHMVSTLGRMESGEIVGITKTGGFNLKSV